MKPRTGTDDWSTRKQKNCSKMAGAHPKTTVFSRWMWGNGFKIYTETGNVLETIRRFQRQFLNRNVHYCRRSCSKLNHTGHTYCICPLLFVYTVSSDSETSLWNLLIFSRTLPVSVYFKTINTRSSTEKCGLGCAPTIFVLVLLLSAPFIFVCVQF